MSHRRTASYQGPSAMHLLDRACQPVDGAWLAAFRMLYGVTLAVSMARFLVYGWVERLFVEPRFHFKYWGFSWVKPLPDLWMHGLFVGLCALALLVAAGLMFRVAAFLLALGLSYFQLIDVSTYLNHYYLAALLCWLLAVVPAHRMWSVDAWRSRRKGVPAVQPQVPAGVLWLFRLQVAIVYVSAGLAKAQPDWLIHGQPLRIWLGASTELPVLGPLLTVPEVPLVMSWAGFLFDLTIVLWLSLRRTRPFAYAVLLLFHGLTRLLFPIGMFPVIMSVSALSFFSPAWPRRCLAVLWGAVAPVTALRMAWLRPPAAATVMPSAGTGTGRKRWLAAAAGLHCLVQVALPLRYLAYGGNVLWHEQGMRFSWRVMVRAKGGSTEFEVVESGTGQRLMVHPRVYLTGMQQMEMSSQPDLILQLAHHIERDMQRRGLSRVEVRALSRVSLNGRRSRPLVDPGMDLTKIQDSLLPAAYIAPAPLAPPPHTRPVL